MNTVQEIRVNPETGKTEKVMEWPVPENADKSWGASGYERDSFKTVSYLNAGKVFRG